MDHMPSYTLILWVGFFCFYGTSEQNYKPGGFCCVLLRFQNAQAAL